MNRQTFSRIVLGGLAALVAYTIYIRPWHLGWGATPEEASRTFPGDELVPDPKLNATHAITIQAPASLVWTWLIQIGQGRGGFYSYAWLERLMGLDIQNADRLLPEHQNLKVGDQIPLAQGGFGVPVAVLEPEKTLVLHGDTRLDPSVVPTLAPGDYFNLNWGFYLEPVNPRATRLIERWRADWNPSWENRIFMRVFLEPGAFLMERKMLLGIKERAERILA
jgi:hypothetical protein